MTRYSRLSRRREAVRARHADMALLHRMGNSISAIARHFGCARKTVSDALDKPRAR